MAGPQEEPSKVGPLPYSLGAWSLRLISLALLCAIALLFLPDGLTYVRGWEKHEWLRNLVTANGWIMKNIGGPIRNTVPTDIAGADRTVWILAIGLFIVNAVVVRYAGGFAARADYLKLRRSVEEWEKKMGLAKNSAHTSELNAKLATLKEGKKADREELLALFAETKRKLSGMGRELAFLAVDIAGSTQMKVGEEQESIEHDFKQYKIFATEIFQANGVVKTAWTPDGVMACFSNIDTAMKAGKDIIRGLERFNREVKLMKTDFTVRCGVNAGYVYMDDSVPLEEVSDRVIDIAGHMQKYAEPNTVAVAKTVVEPITDRNGFRETAKVVDGYQVYAWRHGDPE